MPTVLLILGAASLALTVNAFAPRRDRVLMVPSFFSSWLTIELAPWGIAFRVGISVAVIAAGALDDGRGWIGLGLMAVSVIGLVAIAIRARRTTVTFDSAFKEFELDPDDDAPSFPRSHVVFPFLGRFRSGVEKCRRIVFAEVDGRRLRLDLFRPEGEGTGTGPGRPGLLYVSGGAWVMGFKERQGIPLMNHMAANGWVTFTVDYRLSPKFKFPAHLIDVKRAIAWYREHASAYGADPDFLCVAGNSAGGHLCALLALTANDPQYQPGFEAVETSVDAAVPFYGVYDFTNRLASAHKNSLGRFYEPIVMGARLDEDPDAFARASPIDQVRPDAPPFLVIHGDIDTLAPVADARLFVDRLRTTSDSPVVYAEMQGSQHAFDVFPSYRTARVIEAVERFLRSIHRAYSEGRTGVDVSDEELAEPITDEVESGVRR